MPAADETEYAGLWRRLIAFLIDLIIVGAAVSTVVLLLATAFPKLADLMTLDSPYAVFASERTIDGKANAATATGHVVKTVERTVWGHWTYRYRVTEDARGTPKLQGAPATHAEWQQIDPATGEDIDATSVSDLAWLALLFYWPLMEASRLQTSLGKWAVGIKVTDELGARLGLAQAAGRNVLKLVSAATLMIGFLMVPFTRRRQALHDLFARTLLPLSV